MLPGSRNHAKGPYLKPENVDTGSDENHELAIHTQIRVRNPEPLCGGSMTSLLMASLTS